MNAKVSHQLSIVVEGGQLKISIGIALLAYAVQHQNSWPKKFAVTDLREFAQSMARQLQREEEDGTTPVHRMLDAAADEVLEQGDDGVDEGNVRDGIALAKFALDAEKSALNSKGGEQQIEAAIDAYRERIYLTDADVHASVSRIVEAANTHHPALNGNRPENPSPHANLRADPVAWRVRVKGDDPEEWALLPAGGGADFLNRDGYECQPLYTSAALEASDAV